MLAKTYPREEIMYLDVPRLQVRGHKATREWRQLFSIGCKTSLTFYGSFFNTTAPRPLVIRPSADLTGPVPARYSPQWWVDTVDMISQWTGVTAEQLTSLGTNRALVSMFGTLACITWYRERE